MLPLLIPNNTESKTLVFYVLGFASNANCYFGSLINSNSIFYGYVASKNKNIKQCPTEGCLGSDRRSQPGERLQDRHFIERSNASGALISEPSPDDMSRVGARPLDCFDLSSLIPSRLPLSRGKYI